MLTVQVICEPEKLSGMEGEWDELVQRSFSDAIFLTWEWVNTWWEVYGPGKELHILALRDGATLVGLMPLYRKRSGFSRFATLRFIGSEGPCADYLDCIAARGHEERVFEAIRGYFGSSNREWDLLELTDLAEESLFLKYLKEQGNPSLKEVVKHCPYVRLAPSWDDFLMSLSSKKRYAVRYDRRTLEKLGTVALHMVRDPAELDEAMQEMIRLHQDRLESLGHAGSFSSADYVRFHRNLCGKLIRKGWLHLGFLTVDGQRVAFRYQFSYKNKIYDFQTGFDTSWARQSVAKVLLGLLIEHAINEGRDEFDFLRGMESYKYEWAITGERALVDLEMVRPGARGALYRSRCYLRERARVVGKRVLSDSMQTMLKKVLGSLRQTA